MRDRGSRRREPRLGVIPAVILALATGCGLPIDPEGTLGRVRGGTMRVGVVHHPPWTDVRGEGGPSGEEAELVGRLADALGARVAWTVGGETALMQQLERHRLDLVVGGITDRTAWRGRVGMSRPHAERGKEKFVLVVPPGENGWLLFLDRWIARRATPGEGRP